jgi:hypothetical protein
VFYVLTKWDEERWKIWEKIKAHPLQQALDFNATELYNEHFVQKRDKYFLK